MADQVKISETMEFLTQMHTTWDNSEQRAALRTRPRRSISYDYIGIEPWQSQYIRAMAYAKQTQLMQIPLWHAAYCTKRGFISGDSTIAVEPSVMWQFRGCSFVQLWTSDKTGGAIYPINMLFGDGTINLKKNLPNFWARGTVITPLPYAILSQENKFSSVSSDLSSMTMSFELMRETQAPQIPNGLGQDYDEKVKLRYGQNLSKTYDGYELFLTPPAWNNEITANFKRNAYRMDNETGSFLYDLRSNNPTETREIEYVLSSRSEINNMQRFFCRCMGRLHSFYAPTWLNDVELAVDANEGDLYLLTKWPEYYRYFQNISRRKCLIVFYKDGTAEILKLSGYSTDNTGNFGKIFLNSTLKRAINRSSVALISFLCKYRLNTDTMTTDYETVELATSSLSFAEVDN